MSCSTARGGVHEVHLNDVVIIMVYERYLKRYDRQIRLIGADGQEKLKKGRIFIAGAGGLGSPISIYLAVAGVGKIVLVDRDEVELSNLNRQILHWEKDLGIKKAFSAQEKLRSLNPDLVVEALPETLDQENASTLIGDADLIIDAMDNYPVRYLLNGIALKNGIPFIHGAIWGFHGQVATIMPGETACLRCIFPQAPPPSTFPVIGNARHHRAHSSHRGHKVPYRNWRTPGRKAAAVGWP